MSAASPSCPKAEVYHDEWDMLISEFGLESEPMALPLSRADIKKRLLARAAIPLSGKGENANG